VIFCHTGFLSPSIGDRLTESRIEFDDLVGEDAAQARIIASTIGFDCSQSFLHSPKNPVIEISSSLVRSYRAA
jgi:hypothetical protein